MMLGRYDKPTTAERCCPACRAPVAAAEAAIDVRGMRFHTRCARYRSRARGVPRTQR